MKNIQYVYEPDDSRWKDFLLSFINGLIILIASFAIYFSIFYPIGLQQYKADRKNINETREVLLNIGIESKLMHSDENKKQVYSLTSSYLYYVRTLLRYGYECGDYDMEKDTENYKLKKDEMALFPLIDGFNDDFLGSFYTNFAYEHHLYELNGATKEDYFKYEVLNIDDENDGGVYFQDNHDNAYPHLKDEVRLALYNYAVIGATSAKYGSIDKQFFNYFAKIYDRSGNLLLTYEPYKTAFDSYNVSYQKVYNYTSIATYVSFIVPLLVIAIIVPLFNKNRQNVAQLILKRVDLCDGKLSKRAYITRFIYDLFGYFPTIFFLMLVTNSEILFYPLFYIQAFSFNIFIIIILLTLLNIVSLMLGLIKRDHRNLCSIISQSDSYFVKKI